MKQTLQIARMSLRDVSRNMWLLSYTAFFSLLALALFQFQSNGMKVVISLTSVCLVLIPLISVLFGTLHFYNLREFIELMLTQPIKRSTVYLGMYLGLAVAMVGGFLIGVGMPFLIFGLNNVEHLYPFLILVLLGSMLTLIFIAISFFIGALIDDKGKGVTVAISSWLLMALLYDGLILLVATMFSDYPLEKPLLVLSMANPIDLSRVVLLVQSDLSALMGVTGATFNRFFGTSAGAWIACLSLFIWLVAPLSLGNAYFERKDF